MPLPKKVVDDQEAYCGAVVIVDVSGAAAPLEGDKPEKAIRKLRKADLVLVLVKPLEAGGAPSPGSRAVAFLEWLWDSSQETGLVGLPLQFFLVERLQGDQLRHVGVVKVFCRFDEGRTCQVVRLFGRDIDEFRGPFGGSYFVEVPAGKWPAASLAALCASNNVMTLAQMPDYDASKPRVVLLTTY